MLTTLSVGFLFFLGSPPFPGAAESPRGGCSENGAFLPNGTIWYSEPCERCQCLYGVKVCTQIQCQFLECPKDRQLISVPQECCPKCMPRLHPCTEGDVQYKHGVTWALSHCVNCQCYNGTILCEKRQCTANLQCQEGEEAKEPITGCCPECSLAGKQCRDGSKIYSPGEIWAPKLCVKCQCRSGSVRCFVAKCQSINCPLNHTLELLPGKCCPTCVGISCTSNGIQYENGARWRANPCTHCSCNGGKIDCYKEVCPELVSCPKNRKKLRLEGQCCQKCVTDQGWCVLGDGSRAAPGSQVASQQPQTCSEEEVRCFCINGTVECQTMFCQETACGPGARLQEPVPCRCRKCVPDPGGCYSEGLIKQNGEMWTSECTLCGCFDGRVSCHIPTCPTCPGGFYASPTNSTHFPTCCPTCLPLACPATCERCSPLRSTEVTFSVTCTACKNGYLLENGRCVGSCGDAMFEKSGRCLSCHETCSACSEETRFHCTSCSSHLLLHGNECVATCPSGFHSSNGRCQACHSSCQRCSGDSASDCLQCYSNAKMMNGTCLDSCPNGLVGREGRCEKCAENCELCSSNECLKCYNGYVMQNRHCFRECQEGYYEGSDNTCYECHPSCGACSGPGITACLSCSEERLLAGKLCLPSCPAATFPNEGKCFPCHDTCSKCIHGGLNGCLKCKEANKKLLIESETRHSSGTCVDSCPSQHLALKEICIPESPNCEDPHPADPSLCLACRSGFLLQQYSCLSVCHRRFFPTNSSCLECSPLCDTCSKNDTCDTCPTWASKKGGSSPSHCSPKCQKGSFFDLKLTTCRACHESCEDCVTPPSAGNSVCLKCRNTSFLLEGEKCVESCSLGSFGNKGRCALCHRSCHECSGPLPNQCSSCHEGFKLTSNGTCQENVVQCGDDCVFCKNDSRLTCPECDTGTHFLSGKCMKECPSQFYPDSLKGGSCRACDRACNGCHGPSSEDCVECQTSMKRQGNRCLPNCSSGYFEYAGHCYSCRPGCKDCSSENNCTNCESAYLLEDGFCVPSCKSGFGQNQWGTACIGCGTNCKQCSTSLECQKCVVPFLVENGRCVKECSHSYFVDVNKEFCYFNNDPPTLRSKSSIEINYNSVLSLNTTFVDIADEDTPRDNLLLNIVEPPTNCELFVIHENGARAIVRRGENIGIRDIESGRVMLRHSFRSSFNGRVSIRANDGHLFSPIEAVAINIVSKFGPEIIAVEPLISRKWGKTIITEDNLKIRDLDNQKEVVVRILEKPSSGIISIKGNEVESFTIQELEELQVSYEFSKTKHKKRLPESHYVDKQITDTVILQVCDGYNYVNLMFEVFLVDSRNPAPVLLTNRGAAVQEHQSVQIMKAELEAKDVDSEEADIVYSIHSSDGTVVMVIPLPLSPTKFFNDGWIQMDQSHLSRATTSFTQKDINEGRVWFVPDNDTLELNNSLTNGTLMRVDEIRFSISDSSKPPNVLKDQTFVIHTRMQKDASQSHEGQEPQGLKVFQGQAATITSHHLSFTGRSSNDNLVYTISHPLSPTEGSLFHIDSPGLELRQFTQADINDMKIIYMPPLDDIGGKEKMISFKFKITDGTTHHKLHSPEQKFTIRILPPENQLSFLHPNPEVVVPNNGTVELSLEFFILADVHDEVVTVFLLEAPRFGTLLMKTGVNDFPQYITEETELTLKGILNSRIFYTNDGSEGDSDSAFFLALSHKSEATTRIIFKIEFVDSQKPVPSENASFILHIKEGETKLILPETLHFTDHHSEDDELIYTLTSQPSLGNLLFTDSVGKVWTINQTDKLKQKDISNGMVSYNSFIEIGLETATERLLFNVTDPHNNALTNQILKIVILPTDNQPPNFLVVQKITVPEGGVVPLSLSIMSFSDIDSDLGNLKLVFDVPPLYGYISHPMMTFNKRDGDGSPPVAQVLLKDLMEGKVFYNQSQHRYQEPSTDSMVVHLTDGTNSSPTQEIKILIQELNDEIPVIVGEQVPVTRGGTVIIKNESLFISDLDSPPDKLFIILERLPQHGSLHKRKQVGSSFKESLQLVKSDKFSFEDIVQELLFYSHDGSKHSKDFIEIKVTDGRYENGGILEFLIRAKVVKPPKLTVNNVLIVSEHWTSVLPSVLSAADDDSSINHLRYIITALPKLGKLQVRDEKEDEWRTLKESSSFFQKDINSERVRYEYTNGKGETLDFFHFNLQDTEENTLMDQVFSVSILPDKNPPKLITNKGLNISELSFSRLSTNVLSATDSEIDPKTISYSVTSSLTSGQFELIAKAHVPITSWTQDDLENGNVGYRHTNENWNESENISLSISDGSNSVTQFFVINVFYVDEIPPYLTLRTLRVVRSSRKVITSYEIRAEDPDTRDQFLNFSIKNSPRNGQILLNQFGRSEQTLSFTMRDILEERVSYLHDEDSSASMDSLMIMVSDLSNKGYLYLENENPIHEASSLSIEILPVAPGMPKVAINKGLSYLEHRDGSVRKTITSSELRIDDSDTSPDDLIFKVSEPPKHGFLGARNDQKHLHTFTQAMVDENQLYYESMSTGENIYQDSFIFDVTDDMHNIIPSTIFHIHWSFVSMSKEEYNVTESDRFVKVLIQRTGILLGNASVTCAITEVQQGNKSEEGNIIEDSENMNIMLEETTFLDEISQSFCTINFAQNPELLLKDNFEVKLLRPKHILLEEPETTLVQIVPKLEPSSLSFPNDKYTFQENEGLVSVQIMRTGNVASSVSVLCITKDLTATGSNNSQDGSQSDFITRFPTEKSLVLFLPDVTESTCNVTLFDDSSFELDEQFELHLQNPSEGFMLGNIKTTLITIQGPNDQSILGFTQDELKVKEDSGYINVTIVRIGKIDHPASVWISSRTFSTIEAEANVDFIPISRQITFESGQSSANFSIRIIDDALNPKYEPQEKFFILMSSPKNATLNPDRSATVLLIKDEEDIPRMEFGLTAVQVKETKTALKVPVIKFGDLSSTTSVLCLTRQRSAKSGEDFKERTNTKDSLIHFPIGVSKVNCEIQIVDDLDYEGEEEFFVKLSNPESSEELTSLLGKNKVLKVTILDAEDKPRITFEKETITVNEPKVANEITQLIIPIVRMGDASKNCTALVTTQDGSAFSGSDYQLLNSIIEIPPGTKKADVKLEIFHNILTKARKKSFKVLLEQPFDSELGSLTSTSVTILSDYALETSAYPIPPIVISLLHYNNDKVLYTETVGSGYPLVCVIPCEHNHPEYIHAKQYCDQNSTNGEEQNILDEVKYSWEISDPSNGDTRFTPFRKLTESTLFTSSTNKVLDSMYFTSRFEVRCNVWSTTEEETYYVSPLPSSSVTIDASKGICNKVANNDYTATHFETELEYFNITDDEHIFKMTIKIAHEDGMVPLISTQPLYDIHRLLTDQSFGIKHACSNLYSGHIFSNSNFTTQETVQLDPYQMEFGIKDREINSINLYQHLNLSSCSWTFVAWQSLAQLLNNCSATIEPSFQTEEGNLLTIRLPIYISFVYPTSAPGWKSVDYESEVSESFSSVSRNNALHTRLSTTAKLQINKVHVDEEGYLVIELTTIAKFRGQFVLHDQLEKELKSKLVAPANLNIHFNLELILDAATWDNPEQMWKAISYYPVNENYTGLYILQLIPCTALPSQAFLHFNPPDCTTHNPANFTLAISAQHPVTTPYTLNADFKLYDNPESFLVDPRFTNIQDDTNYRGNFGRGQVVYGKVLLQSAAMESRQLLIQKVFLCSGKDGFLPKYDPTGEIYGQEPHYGCTVKSDDMTHIFQILDRDSPFGERNSSTTEIEAHFAKDVPEFGLLQTYPGVDGFLFKTDELFDLDSQHQWFIQVLYTIGRREDDFSNGSKIRGFSLSSSAVTSSASAISIAIYIIIPVILVLIILFIGIVLIFKRAGQKHQGDVVVVRSLKNEREEARREEARRKEEFVRISEGTIKPLFPSPATLNCESNLQMMKIKTLAVTVRNNLEEDGTEV